MATETAILANETEIANALNVFGLGNFTEYPPALFLLSLSSET